MSAKAKSTLINVLTNDEMRSFARAAKELVRPHFASVTAAHGLVTQNVYTWMLGRDTLNEDRRKNVMAMVGITHFGQLMANITHAWVIEGREKVDQAELLLSREQHITKVSLQYGYINTAAGKELVGAEIRWESDLTQGATAQPRDHRLIVTALAGSWDEDDFKKWIMDLFLAKRATKSTRIATGNFDISTVSALNIWRFRYGMLRLIGGKRAMTIPRKALLPFDKDVVAQDEANESPLDVLESMTPRFLELANKSAELRGVRVGPKDLALVRRAKASLGDNSK